MDRMREVCGHEDQPAIILRVLEKGCRDKECGFSDFFRNLCDLELGEVEARNLFREIEDHALDMSEAVGHPVGFRVSAADYLLNIKSLLKPPKLIEWERYEHLLSQSTRDPLTGLFNRRYFEAVAEKELMRSKRYGYPFSLLYIDLDNFKKINDSWGHAAGDLVLKGTAEVLVKSLRTEDCAARIGGEEMIVLLPQTDSAGAEIYGDRLLQAIRKYPFTEGIKVTFSGGLASFPRHGDCMEELMQFADRGLYEAKMLGKDRVVVLQEGRRESKRYIAVMPLTFEVGPGNMHDGTMQNISLSGLAINADWEPKTGEEINLRFYVEDGERTYDIRSKIVWTERAANADRHVFGVRYCAKNDPRLFQTVSARLMSQKKIT